MVLNVAEKDKVKALLVEAITVLCKNGLSYDQLSVEGLIGITLNNSDVFLVNINEKFATSDLEGSSSDESDSQSTEHRSSSSRRNRRKARKRKVSQASDHQDNGESRDKSHDADSRLAPTMEPVKKRVAAAASTSDHNTSRDDHNTSRDSDYPPEKVKEEPQDSEDDDDLIVIKTDPGFSNLTQDFASSTPTRLSHDPSVFTEHGNSSLDDSSHMMYDSSAYMSQGDMSGMQPEPGSSNVVVGQTPYWYTNSRNICRICGKVLSSVKSLRQHMEVHQTRKHFKCPQCDFCTSHKRNIKSHVEKKHGSFQSEHNDN